MFNLTQKLHVQLIQARPVEVEGKRYLSVHAAQPSSDSSVYGWAIMKASASPDLGPQFAEIFGRGVCPVEVILDVEMRQGPQNSLKIFIVGVSPVNKPAPNKAAA